ncbi:MAG: ferrous iron transport protein A [Eubacterium sp.]|nr:ferrous iron transport protein A [Eubacterium sp.]
MSELKDGQSGVISSLNFDADFARRLAEMGFCKGKRVKRICACAFGSPILFEAMDGWIALRKYDAQRIEVVV